MCLIKMSSMTASLTEPASDALLTVSLSSLGLAELIYAEVHFAISVLQVGACPHTPFQPGLLEGLARQAIRAFL